MLYINNVFSSAQQPNESQGRLILEVCRSHTVTHHYRFDSSGREIGSSQRHLPEKTTIEKGQASVTTAQFETPIPGSSQPQNLALVRSATGIG